MTTNVPSQEEHTLMSLRIIAEDIRPLLPDMADRLIAIYADRIAAKLAVPTLPWAAQLALNTLQRGEPESWRRLAAVFDLSQWVDHVEVKPLLERARDYDPDSAVRRIAGVLLDVE